MGVALLSWINWLDRAGVSITASSEAGSLRATRLADGQVRRRWRAATTTPQLDVDLGTGREVGVLALAQPDDAGGVDANSEALGRMIGTDTVRHRLDLTTAGAGALLDTGAVAGGWEAGYGLHLRMLSAAVTARYWRCDLSAPSLTSLGFLDLGRAWIGPAWRPARGNIAYGWGWTDEDGGTVATSPRSGLEFVDRGPRRRVLTFAFRSLTAADARGPMRELQRIAGSTGQVLFSLDPDAGRTAETIIGRLVQVPPITQPNFVTFEVAFQIRESL